MPEWWESAPVVSGTLQAMPTIAGAQSGVPPDTTGTGGYFQPPDTSQQQQSQTKAAEPPTTSGTLQRQTTAQYLQDLFTGKNRDVLAGDFSFDPSNMGTQFDPDVLLKLKPWLESLGFKVQIKPSDNGRPSGRIFFPDGTTAADTNINGSWGWLLRQLGLGGDGTPGGLGGNRFLGQLRLPSIFGPGFDFGSGGGAGNEFLANGPIFTDAATIDWENALRDFVTRLRQPIVNPDLDPLVSFMRGEFQRLQGPAYTPEELDLMQTQVFDPLTAQRDVERQNILNWASSHGMGPNDGPTQQLLSDLNRQYSQVRTKGSADVAMKAIDQGRQNRQQALQVGSALTALHDQIFNREEDRITQAIGLLQQIPALADSRLALANSVLMGGQAAAGVAGSAANYLASIYNTQANQQAANAASNRNFWSGLIQAFAVAAPYIFG
jgi:hypothetical protein